MSRRILILSIILLSIATILSANNVVKTFTISKDFGKVAGTPRVVRNAFEHNWAVAWRQQGAPAKIFGRIVDSEGDLKSQKLLVKGVSSAIQSFDIFPDSVNYTYLVAYETPKKELKVQLFTGNLAKSGTPKLIEKGFTGTIPRLAFNFETKQFLLFWLSENLTAIKVIVLDAKGAPIAPGNPKILKNSVAGTTFQTLNVTTNQDTGNLLLTALQKDGGAGQLLGFTVKPNGTLLKAKPISITPSTPALNAFSDASFADSGSGFAFWSEGDDLNRRKISKKGAIASAVKTLPGLADPNSTQTSILFDQRNNLFLGVWAQGNKIRSVGFNTSSGDVAEDPFDVATSTFNSSLNPSTSFDGQLGNVLAVWEDSKGSGAQAKFRIRGALFFVENENNQSGISIGDNFFNAGNGTGDLTIEAGQSITWTNNGSVPHTVTSGSESNNPGAVFNSSNLPRGGRFTFRFTNEGQFPYFCQIHGSGAMRGVITVRKEGEPPPRY